jgi:hypothetical protein
MKSEAKADLKIQKFKQNFKIEGEKLPPSKLNNKNMHRIPSPPSNVLDHLTPTGRHTYILNARGAHPPPSLTEALYPVKCLMYSEQGGGATPLSYFLTEVTKEKKTVQKN